jgi:ParB-like chromosome segregation protein Spo0J
MPVTIEDVLALLPEMFPGVQEIPLKNIRPNPNNPGAPLTAGEIQGLAQNIAVAGLLNPIKVRPNKPNPLGKGVNLHPDNPRLRADGQPWALGDFNLEILTGENRYRAFDYLKREAIPGSILNPTTKEAVKITHLDNEVRDRGWWAAYQSIEQLIQADPDMTQRQIAVELKMDKPKVTRAFALLPLLNPEARALIGSNTPNSNKGIRGISEIAASLLAGLGPERGLKPGVKKKDPAKDGETQKLWPYPPISPEIKDLVRRTLEVAIDRELTEAGVRGLVGWVQDGHKPEEYGSSQGSQKAEISNTPVPKRDKACQFERKKIDPSRVSINPYTPYKDYYPEELERKMLSIQATGFAKTIMVRTLSEEERAADSDHDYEVFDDPLILEAAKRLGWSTLDAIVFPVMDVWDAIGLLNSLDRVTKCSTWIDAYYTLEKLLSLDPKGTVAEKAINLGEDLGMVKKAFPVMRLLNKSAREAISECIRKCFEGRVDIGGYRFSQEAAIPLLRMEGYSEDLLETQELVEKVVHVAIENEMGVEDIEELVDWTLEGNAPSDFYEKEA